VDILITKPLFLTYHCYPPTEIIIDSNESNAAFELDQSQGWVSRIALDGSSRRMCWLPHKRRHKGFIAWSGEKVVVGAHSGIVTILDFSDV
jgi:hypothetical protein